MTSDHYRGGDSGSRKKLPFYLLLCYDGRIISHCPHVRITIGNRKLSRAFAYYLWIPSIPDLNAAGEFYRRKGL